MRLRALISLVVLAACVQSPAAAPPAVPQPAPSDMSLPSSSARRVTGGRALIERMHERYAGRFYRSLSFLQENTAYRPDGSEERTQWMEYQRVPGELRVDYLPLASKSGMIFVRDSIHQFQPGGQRTSRPLVHPLLVLSADVYAQPVERTMEALETLQMNHLLTHETTWEGTPVIVVGAVAGDTVTNQFWVDRERLLLLRVIETRRRPDGSAVATSDTRFTRYQTVEGVPVPEEILFLRNGTRVWREVYTAVKVNPVLDDRLFDPSRFAEAQPALGAIR